MLEVAIQQATMMGNDLLIKNCLTPMDGSLVWQFGTWSKIGNQKLGVFGLWSTKARILLLLCLDSFHYRVIVALRGFWPLLGNHNNNNNNNNRSIFIYEAF